MRVSVDTDLISASCRSALRPRQPARGGRTPPWRSASSLHLTTSTQTHTIILICRTLALYFTVSRRKLVRFESLVTCDAPLEQTCGKSGRGRATDAAGRRSAGWPALHAKLHYLSVILSHEKGAIVTVVLSQNNYAWISLCPLLV